MKLNWFIQHWLCAFNTSFVFNYILNPQSIRFLFITLNGITHDRFNKCDVARKISSLLHYFSFIPHSSFSFLSHKIIKEWKNEKKNLKPGVALFFFFIIKSKTLIQSRGVCLIPREFLQRFLIIYKFLLWWELKEWTKKKSCLVFVVRGERWTHKVCGNGTRERVKTENNKKYGRKLCNCIRKTGKICVCV